MSTPQDQQFHEAATPHIQHQWIVSGTEELKISHQITSIPHPKTTSFVLEELGVTLEAQADCFKKGSLVTFPAK